VAKQGNGGDRPGASHGLYGEAAGGIVRRFPCSPVSPGAKTPAVAAAAPCA